jgi:hypothetical protein
MSRNRSRFLRKSSKGQRILLTAADRLRFRLRCVDTFDTLCTGAGWSRVLASWSCAVSSWPSSTPDHFLANLSGLIRDLLIPILGLHLIAMS